MDAKKVRKAQMTMVPVENNPIENSNWIIHFKGMDTDSLRIAFLNNVEYSTAKDKYTLTQYDQFLALSFSIRERMIERWILTQQKYHNENAKRVYYLSLEFLLGRLLGNNILNLALTDQCDQAMKDLRLDIEDVLDQEYDAGLGNGGLGRLAACFLDSMAALQLPAIGYGIRYEFGIFNQRIIDGYQREVPEQWLQLRNPWEIERPEYEVRIKFYGKTMHLPTATERLSRLWIDTQDVVAIPYDVPIPGYDNNTVNTLRLWSARAAKEFDLDDFNSGDYIGACTEKLSSENISKVLYPNDNNHSGKELRLKQQYFFTSASLQDIIRRYQKHNKNFSAFPDKVAIQLNDTHPSIAIAELMRLFIDLEGLTWDDAWALVIRTFAYTNHTLMPEALETWPVGLMQNLLPRLMEIIYEINFRFLRLVSYKYPGDVDRLRRMSLIEEGPDPKVRMAYLAIVGSHSVNGVAALHTELLTKGLVHDFYEMWPEKFNNKTNGITQRRWLKFSNPSLSKLITSKIGDNWVRDLYELKKLEPLATDKGFQKEWRDIKRHNKEVAAARIKKWDGIELNPDMIWDVQVKRMHEYKRQLLNVLHCIALYNQLKAGNTTDFVPRNFIFAGKAAPGYFMAKLIIKFINSVGAVINNDPATRNFLQVHFLPNYRVSLAESLMPAADVSEQISTAGTEASGTGNMKFALNGALTIGTMDGANIEIREEVGADNIFIFGLLTDEVNALRARGYNPWDFYNSNPELKRVLDLIASGFFSPENPGLFKPLFDTLLTHGDRYMIMADFNAYRDCHQVIASTYRDEFKWTKMSILNVARMGKFSSDRTIRQYAEEIWGAKSVPVTLDQ